MNTSFYLCISSFKLFESLKMHSLRNFYEKLQIGHFDRSDSFNFTNNFLFLIFLSNPFFSYVALVFLFYECIVNLNIHIIV